jgi:hypothetical protein
MSWRQRATLARICKGGFLAIADLGEGRGRGDGERE